MGNYLGQPSKTLSNEVKESRGKKRKYEEESTDEDEAEKIQETLLNTPKK